MTWKVAVANRGEIAVRVILACKELGVRAVALHSDADARSLAVRLADESCRLGPTPARLSYMDPERVVEAALSVGAHAVHPGYGFLAEDPRLARLCQEHGLVFIGPNADAIEAAGDKIMAKKLAQKAGLPVIAWAKVDGMESDLLSKADQVGFPLLVKAAGGGGGRGQILVESPEGLMPAIQAVHREAAQVWHNGALFIERAVTSGRHVEVQILADGQGRVVHLGTRDCSIQRNRQKFLEEAPAQDLPDSLSEQMGWAACSLARSLDFVGAGTVEFLVDQQGHFYFLEINPRIQVEHTVTETVTGFDLVKAQLRISRGEALWITQDQIHPRGHALQARLYAEDPSENFLPSSGLLRRLKIPEGPHIRIDSGYEEGDEVPAAYDPLLAKITVWGEDRSEALMRMRQALKRLVVLGVKTNAELLANLLADAKFRAGAVDTNYLERRLDHLIRQPIKPEVLAAALGVSAGTDAVRDAEANRNPWALLVDWRNGPNGIAAPNEEGKTTLHITGQTIAVSYRRTGRNSTVIRYQGRQDKVILAPVAPGIYQARCSGRGGLLYRLEQPDGTWIAYRGKTYLVDFPQELKATVVTSSNGDVEATSPRRSRLQFAEDPSILRAPTTAHVVAVAVQPGQEVMAGQTIAVLEAMKLEVPIRAERSGRIARLATQVGQSIQRGQVIATLELPPDSS